MPRPPHTTASRSPRWRRRDGPLTVHPNAARFTEGLPPPAPTPAERLHILDQAAEGRIGILAAPSPQLRDQRRVAGRGHRRDLREASRVHREAKMLIGGSSDSG